MEAVTGYTEDKKRHTDITSFKEAFMKEVVPYRTDLMEVMEMLQTYHTHGDKNSLTKARTRMAELKSNEPSELMSDLEDEVRNWNYRYGNDAELNRKVRNWP